MEKSTPVSAIQYKKLTSKCGWIKTIIAALRALSFNYSNAAKRFVHTLLVSILVFTLQILMIFNFYYLIFIGEFDKMLIKFTIIKENIFLTTKSTNWKFSHYIPVHEKIMQRL